MSVTVGLEPLLDYSDHERRKWHEWIAADPARLSLPFQPGGRFPTVGSLIDHVFLVERRHLCRLAGAALPEQTGVPPGDWQRLFEYGDLVRADFRRYIADLTDIQADGLMTFEAIGVGPVTMSRRRLTTHCLLHEVRHLAQLAFAARKAGLEPPGKHDLFFFDDFA
jgi:uncharacterized damage-inducible protein DinB